MRIVHVENSSLPLASTRGQEEGLIRDIRRKSSNVPSSAVARCYAIASTAKKVVLFLSVLAMVAPIGAETCLNKNGDCQDGASQCCPGFTCFHMGWYSQCHESVAPEGDFCCTWDDCAQKRECDEGLNCVDYGSYTECEPESEADEVAANAATETPVAPTGVVETCVHEFGACFGSDCCTGMQCADFGEYTQCRQIGDSAGACLTEEATCGLGATPCCPPMACVRTTEGHSACREIGLDALQEDMFPIVVVESEENGAKTSPTASPTPAPIPSPTPQPAPACSAEWQSCLAADCCDGMTCYKHQFFSECRQPTYDPGTCRGNYHQCNDSNKPCCEGLECREIDDNYSQCLVPSTASPPLSTDKDGDLCLAEHGDCMNSSEACCSGLKCILLNENFAQCRKEYAAEYEGCAVRPCMEGLTCVDYDNFSQCRKVSDVGGTNDDAESLLSADGTCHEKWGDCHDGKGCCNDLLCIKLNEFQSQCMEEFAKEGEDCTQLGCRSGLVCVKYNDYFAQCRKPSDVPELPSEKDPDSDREPDGSDVCEGLFGNCHDYPDSCCDDLVCIQLNDFFSQCRNHCAEKYHECKHQDCCDGLECYQRDEHYSQCRDPNDPDDDIDDDDNKDVCRPIWGECTGDKTCCEGLNCVYFDDDYSQCQAPSDPDDCVVEFHECSDSSECCSGLSCVNYGPDDIKCRSTPTSTRRGLRSSVNKRTIRTG